MTSSAQPHPMDDDDARYGEFRPAEPTRHEIDPDSWLAQAAGAAALRSRPWPAAQDRAWDPLTDPWPIREDAPEPTWHREEHAALVTQPFELGDHPSGPLPRAGMWPPQGEVPSSPAELMAGSAPAPEAAPVARRYDVTLMGPLGEPEFGFGQGRWYALAGPNAREVAVAEPLRAHPDKAGQVVQLACWWLRENPNQARALDLATELSMAISELARRTMRV